MSEKLSFKDVKANALRLMEEKDYDSALKNWLYIKKGSDDTDPFVLFNIGKCYEYLDSSLSDASKAYRLAISQMAENPGKMQDKLFLELLFNYGHVEKRR